MTTDQGEPMASTTTAPIRSEHSDAHGDETAGTTAAQTTEYLLAAHVFYHKAPGEGPRRNIRDGVRYVRGDTIALTDDQAPRLLRCGAVVPLGTSLPPEPATVAYGDPVELNWDERSRKAIERDVAEGRLRPPSGPNLFVK